MLRMQQPFHENNLSIQHEIIITTRIKNCRYEYGNTKVHGEAKVYDFAEVYGDAEVYGEAEVSGNTKVYDFAKVYGRAELYGNTKVYGNMEVHGGAMVYGNAELHGNTEVRTDISKTPDHSTLNFFEETVKSNGNIDLNELSRKQLIALMSAWNSDFAKEENASFSEMVKRCYKPIHWHEDANIIYLHKDNRRTTIISYTFFHFNEAEDKLIHDLLAKLLK